MFTSGFAEGTQQTIELRDDDKDALCMMIRRIYDWDQTNELEVEERKDIAVLANLLAVADKYEVAIVRDEVISMLLDIFSGDWDYRMFGEALDVLAETTVMDLQNHYEEMSNKLSDDNLLSVLGMGEMDYLLELHPRLAVLLMLRVWKARELFKTAKRCQSCDYVHSPIEGMVAWDEEQVCPVCEEVDDWVKW
ncbi:hypothetical protein C1H76_1023 [Elsinoe australis]|uniref:BTB domain-containing protein n=1 Tax=Elsinoe australis TaxID=40998 RepID=A0A4U7BFH4_9PEZI|nr:hypothetical protein C1H76_1023 [Elsinoe australis]